MDSKSITLYDCFHYSVRLEYSKELVILHLPRVTNFSLSVLKSMQEKVLELLDFLLDLGYNGVWAGCPNDNSQIKKLLHLLGFEYVKDENNVSMFNIGVK